MNNQKIWINDKKKSLFLQHLVTPQNFPTLNKSVAPKIEWLPKLNDTQKLMIPENLLTPTFVEPSNFGLPPKLYLQKSVAPKIEWSEKVLKQSLDPQISVAPKNEWSQKFVTPNNFWTPLQFGPTKMFNPKN